MSSKFGTERVCLVPRLRGVGGMVSFQHKLAKRLAERGIQVTYDLQDRPYRSVLIVGGTRNLPGLARAQGKGAQLVQRLDGMNWLHRVRLTGLRHFLRAEYGNWLLGFIRARLADRIVYQSQFSKAWWERKRGQTRTPHTVIYNGVDLESYSPAGEEAPPHNIYRILLVEGALGGGYEQGLETAVKLAERLSRAHSLPVELAVAGQVSPSLAAAWQQQAKAHIKFLGLVPREQIPGLDRSAHLLYSSDLNAACPNSVVEALACGLPVLAFDTGALPELVQGDSGRLAAYGGDPWQLDPPDIAGLAQAAMEILQGQDRFRPAARRQAETVFGLDAMVDAYLQVLL